MRTLIGYFDFSFQSTINKIAAACLIDFLPPHSLRQRHPLSESSLIYCVGVFVTGLSMLGKKAHETPLMMHSK